MLTPKDIIQKLRPCSYKYNDLKDLGGKIQFGFLAQEILEDFGDEYDFVRKDPNSEYYQVNYYQFIAPLVSMVKSQQNEINELKEELQKLKEKLCSPTN